MRWPNFVLYEGAGNELIKRGYTGVQLGSDDCFPRFALTLYFTLCRPTATLAVDLRYARCLIKCSKGFFAGDIPTYSQLETLRAGTVITSISLALLGCR